MHLYHILFIHSFPDRYLGWFYFLTIENSVPINMGIHLVHCYNDFISSDIYQVMELLGHIIILILVFERIPIMFSIMVVKICIPINSIQQKVLLYLNPHQHLWVLFFLFLFLFVSFVFLMKVILLRVRWYFISKWIEGRSTKLNNT